jgi:mannuronan 5-epimerase
MKIKYIGLLLLTVAAMPLFASIFIIEGTGSLLPPVYAVDEDDDNDCVNHSDGTIEVTCDISFAQLAKNVNGDSVLKNLGNGTYLLSADLKVNEGAKLVIAAPDVTWIKISNKGSSQYNILVDGGQMDIYGTKITSWDPDKNSVVEQNEKGSIPRPYINYQDSEDGVIQNSELAYMGYAGNEKRGLSFTKTTANIEIRNSDFHHWWYAFYSNGAKNVTIDNSTFHDNYKYAIDPHTGTHDMNITNNHVYNNPGSGIICSLDCSDILIQNNTVHDNGKHGIGLSRNMHESIIRNNTIYNSPRGIVISESPKNEVYGNMIYNTSDGFHLTVPSSPPIDGHTTENRIYNNTIRDSENGFVIIRADDNTFANNTLENIRSFEYSIKDGAEIAIENQHFTDDKFAGASETNKVAISNSGMIIDDSSRIYDTGSEPYTGKLSDEAITITSIK